MNNLTLNPDRIKIAVDAMGGDFAPQEVIKGAVEASRQDNIEVILVGPSELLQKELNQYDLGTATITVCEASETIGMDEDPVRAIRRKKHSSIIVGINLVKTAQASAFVSGGSTGAITAAALLTLGRKKGISRPALGIVYQSPGGSVLLLDVGANSDCKPQHLLQFAEMGTVYMSKIHQIVSPKIGLISTGEESTKGNNLARSTHDLLLKSDLNFVGNVEGQDIPTTTAHILVTDGFTGNIVIKLSEGWVATFAAMSKKAAGNPPANQDTEKSIQNQTALGGAILFGVKGNVIITHGKSDSTAIRRAVQLAEKMVAQKVTEAIGH